MAVEDAQVVVSAIGLTKTFRGHGGDVPAVKDVSFGIATGATLGMVGESGSGKSTIGRMIVGLERPTAGRLVVLGQDMAAPTRDDLRSLRSNAQIVFQDPVASLNPRQTVAKIIGSPLRAYRKGSRRAQSERVREVAHLAGLDLRHLLRYPRELSGGQCQRVGIARALAIAPKLVVLDEAVTALDLSMRAEILNLLRDLQREMTLTYLFISHDLAIVRYMAETICVLHDGRLEETTLRDEVFTRASSAYTRQLIAAIVEPPETATMASGRLKSTSERGASDRVSDVSSSAGCRARKV